MKNREKAPRAIRIMRGAFIVALAFFTFFVIANRSHASLNSTANVSQHYTDWDVAAALIIYVFFQISMLCYVASFFLSIWNAATWLNRGGKYFWTSAGIFFGDVAMFAWIMTH
jgi:hypothetical protein